MFYNKAKKTALRSLKSEEERYSRLGDTANDRVVKLFEIRKSASKAIARVEQYVNTLANTPKEFLKEIHEVKLNLKEFDEAVRIEKENSANNLKTGTMIIGGVTVGGAVAALGPTTLMAIATTFGTASTGTAIASLSGAAATNAALAWLGGGAVAAGGGGMLVGNFILALAGPVGWGIAGAVTLGGSLWASNKNKKVAQEADEITKELVINRRKLLKKIKLISSLISETEKLKPALSTTLMVNRYPNDYLSFNDSQKQGLGALINNAKAMGELINKRIE